MSGYINSALVLNTSIPVSGRSLTITLQLVKGSHTIISAIEIFEIVRDEAKTLLMKVLLKHFLEFEALKRILMKLKLFLYVVVKALQKLNHSFQLEW
uniref:Uncharacterized protein n=1 Tax=Lactuca sativa TaxID=4236 RepID=A0A9R1W6Q8_LACSA|nr:hypothetical protein LSAT_V11C300151420 [Lactuca sativa]